MTPDRLVAHPPFTIHQYAVLGSTNDQLKSMGEAPEFTCVVAASQTAGRGRRDRAWHSSPGDGLYLSVLLRPTPAAAPHIPLLSLLSAVAVAETLIGLDVGGVDIKWPNDVLVKGRKISGILVEGASGANSLRVILGIGVNLNHPSFPPEIAQIATSLLIETGNGIEVDRFRDRLLDRIAHGYAGWARGDFAALLDRWRERSSTWRGQRVQVSLDVEQLTGTTVNVTESGALLVRTDAGELRAILAGDVTRLRAKSEQGTVEQENSSAGAR
ncbi:MAG: biotin--[acetyl-CoA-carboxylase] ligase [Blastocatellia bacterium]|nr:biotin--[acetyl-CoA-carboxylase] ligase [Blastocatellia bacterium]